MGVTSTQDLSGKDFDAISIGSPYSDLLGQVSPGFSLTVHGQQGSGKSTFTLGLCYHLLPHAIAHEGSVLFVSAEEGAGKTAQGKADRLNVLHERLLISDAQSVDTIKDEAQEHDAHTVAIDSGNRVDPTSNELIDLLHWCQSNGTGLIFVLRQTKKGNYAGSSKLVYDPEIEVECYKTDTGQERARTNKNRHHPAPRDIKIPMTAEEIGDPVDAATAFRENPNCKGIDPNEEYDDPEKEARRKQCAAMFISLRESGNYDPVKAGADTPGDPSGSSSDSGGSADDTEPSGPEDEGVETEEAEPEEAVQKAREMEQEAEDEEDEEDTPSEDELDEVGAQMAEMMETLKSFQ